MPDVAELTTAVTSNGATAAAALAANNAASHRLIAAVRAAGIRPRDVRTGGLIVRPRLSTDGHGNETDAIAGCCAANQVTLG